MGAFDRNRRVSLLSGQTTRRRVLLALAAAGIAAPRTNPARPADRRVHRVGWLHLGKAWDLGQFRRPLAELGWIEDRNIAIEPRFADNDEERLSALAAELTQLPVDVIVTQTTVAAVAASRATATVPIVMAGSSNPVKLGIVHSLARPGGNVTGVTNNPGVGFITKMAQLLKEAAPRMARLAILARGVESDVWVEIESSAPRLAFTVVNAQANTHDEVPDALAAALRAGADSVFAPPNPINDAQRKAIVEFALANRWPAIGGDRYFVAAGGLMSYWADWVTIRRQAASYVDQILRGANPAEMPIEQPTKLELVLNLRTAAAIGLTIPQAVRLRADELIG